MKVKTINKVLSNKFNEWLESITDETVKNLVKNNSIITGGCIASMLLKEPVNDYDVYFTNKETVKAVAEYYLKQFNLLNNEDGFVLDGADYDTTKFVGGVSLNMTPERIKIVFPSKGVAKEAGTISDEQEVEEFPDGRATVEDESKPKYRPIYMSCNAITLSNQIQIVIRFYGNAEEIHGHYDYVHCTNYWESKDKNLVLKQPALESLIAKELIYNGSLYPLASVIRTRKFIKRGWSINAGQYLKMAFQISKLNLSNVAVLEDQLVGVDVAYFNMLIDALVEHTEKLKNEGKEFTIEYGYLASIIDKIF